MRSLFTFSLLPVDVQYLVFTFLTPFELCTAARVNSNFLRISSDDTLWKQLCRREFNWINNDTLIKEAGNESWKQQYISWSSSTWSENRSPEIEISKDRRTATNRYHSTQELGSGTWRTILGVAGVSKQKSRIRRRFNLRIDFNPYVVACGIVSNDANVHYDLSGSSPSLSLFSNGKYYANPSEVAPIDTPTPFNSSKFTTGDLVSIIVDMNAGVVEFRRNDEILSHYSIPTKYTNIKWYPAVTLSRDARITMLPDNSLTENLDLSHVYLSDMAVDESKTSLTEAQ